MLSDRAPSGQDAPVPRDADRRSGPAGRKPPLPARPNAGRRTALAWFAIACLTALAFLPITRNLFVDWDDYQCIAENPHLRSLSGENLRWMATTGHMAQWQPLGWLVLALQYQVFAFDPGSFARGLHTISLLLHIGVALLCFLVVRRLLEIALPSAAAASRARLDGTAALSALLYAVHPLRVEVVAWATAQPYLWATLGCLASVWFYLCAWQTGRARDRYLSLTCFGLSLLFKPIGVPLPAVLLVLDGYPLRRLGSPRGGRSTAARGVWLEKLPYAGLSLVAMIVAPLVKASMGSAAPWSEYGLVARAVQAAHGFWFYPVKTLLPAGLSPIYELHTPLRYGEPRYLAALAASAGLLAYWILRGRRFALLTSVVLAYGLLIFPVLGFFQSGNQETADRYAYLPAMAFSAAAAAGLFALFLRGDRRGRAAGAIAAGAAILVLCVLTARLCRVWHDTATLWTHAVAQQQDSSIAQNGHGYVLLEQGRTDEALARFRTAIRLQPLNAQAYRNLWTALRAQGRTPELIAALEEAQARFPNEADIPYYLANAYARQGDLAPAIAAYRQALALAPDQVPIMAALANALQESGDNPGAIEQAQRALARDPRQISARLALARALHAVGQSDEARGELRTLLSMEPGNAAARQLLAAWEERP